jgi:hypothetical protein
MTCQSHPFVAAPTPTHTNLRRTVPPGVERDPCRFRRPDHRPGSTYRNPSRCVRGAWGSREIFSPRDPPPMVMIEFVPDPILPHQVKVRLDGDQASPDWLGHHIRRLPYPQSWTNALFRRYFLHQAQLHDGLARLPVRRLFDQDEVARLVRSAHCIEPTRDPECRHREINAGARYDTASLSSRRATPAPRSRLFMMVDQHRRATPWPRSFPSTATAPTVRAPSRANQSALREVAGRLANWAVPAAALLPCSPKPSETGIAEMEERRAYIGRHSLCHRPAIQRHDNPWCLARFQRQSSDQESATAHQSNQEWNICSMGRRKK